jgi:phage terminase small subunit
MGSKADNGGMSDLTPRQAKFVQEYLVDLNATQAAIRAGYSEKTADVQGPRLLGNVGVAAAIAAAGKRVAAKADVTVGRVVAELAKIGFSSLGDVTDWGVKEVAIGYDADGKRLRAEDIGDAAVVHYVDAPWVKPINRDDLPVDVRAAVAEVSLGREGFKIKMHDKAAALQQLGRYLGMFVDKTEVTGPDGGPIKAEMTDQFAALPKDARDAIRAAVAKALDAARPSEAERQRAMTRGAGE